MTATAGDQVTEWRRFGLTQHGRVMIVGFRDAAIPIELDRIFVPLYVYVDAARRGDGPDSGAGADKEGLNHGGAEISFDDALARASHGRTCLALIGDPGAGKTTLLRHLFRRVVLDEVDGAVHLRRLYPVLVRLATVTDAELARLVLQPLAYAMHEHDQRELSAAEAAVLVEPPLLQVPEVRAMAPTPERFLDLVRDECGVLKSRDLGRIEFVHLSFQEYLAACHVATRGLGRTLAERAGDPRWEEVILLAMSRPGVFEPFMTRVLERSDVDLALLRQCLRETRQIIPEPFEAAADHLGARLRAPASPRFARRLLRRQAPSEEEDKLRRLFELVTGFDLPGMVKRARAFVDCNDLALRAAARRLVGLEEATGVGAATYPVTNEQYAQFMAETKQPAPASFADRRFNDAAQPVVMVSWEEARAFARWLTGKLSGVVARLPTEAEWEYAARGTDGRRHPWGDEAPDAARATFGQPEGRPAVVGHTPGGVSPFGVHDLAGNVWEWCLDAWANSYAEIEAGSTDPCHQGDLPGGTRVFRGGSWSSRARVLRSACRSGNRPHLQNHNLGFRVVCGGSSQSDAP